MGLWQGFLRLVRRREPAQLEVARMAFVAAADEWARPPPLPPGALEHMPQAPRPPPRDPHLSRSVAAGQLSVLVPPPLRLRYRCRFADGDWSPWRSASGEIRLPLACRGFEGELEALQRPGTD